ncbi:MAG: hypothetical protein IJJ91_10670 [Synergistaceae bacterium]|nr:hypothetical protein [Synergistaceae bacterium]MBR0168648.1 hypothetical protein [Synergistaceae bacterium]MBR0232637.1 hypothetical protein [Synergistaceae bacterium]
MKAVTSKDIIGLAEKLNSDSKVDFENFDPGKKILEQGLDSLDLSRLLFEIEEKFQITFPDDEFSVAEWDTINKIVEKVNALRQTS